MGPEFFKKRIPNEVKSLNKKLAKKPVVLFMLAKKVAGKGTYSKWLERVTDNKFMQVAVGDMMREGEAMANMMLGRALLHDTLKEEGFDEAKIRKFIENMKKLDQSKLYPTPKITTLLKVLLKEIAEENPGKSLIIDGLPRDVDQVEVAIALGKEYEKQKMDWFFVEIDCAESVLEARLKERRVCPECGNSRNIQLLLTPRIEHDKDGFHLVCDSPGCKNVRMIKKPGDELGLEPIRDRQDLIAKVMKKSREKVPTDRYITVSNTVPVAEAKKHNQKDFTEAAELSWDKDKKKVKVEYSPWIVKDDDGLDAYSRYAEPVVGDLIKELVARL